MPSGTILYGNIIAKMSQKRNALFHFYSFAQINSPYLGRITALFFFFILKENNICVMIN